MCRDGNRKKNARKQKHTNNTNAIILRFRSEWDVEGVRAVSGLATPNGVAAAAAATSEVGLYIWPGRVDGPQQEILFLFINGAIQHHLHSA